MRDNKKTALLRAVCFGVLLALLLQGLGLALIPKSNRYLSGYAGGGVFGEQAESLEILVLGNSNSAQSVSPMEWWHDRGWAGYSYGQAWLDVYEASALWKRILREQSPKVLLLETDLLLSARWEGSELEKMLVGLGQEAFPLLRWHDRWKETGWRDWTAAPDWSWQDPAKGFAMYRGAVPYEGGDYMIETGEDAALTWEQRLFLDRILALCQREGCTLVLFAAPSAVCCSLTRSRAVAQWADRRGAPFWDLNLAVEEMGLDWSTDTPDGGAHLNLWGARKVTAALERRLAEGGFALTDHRGEPGWEEWDQDWERYRTDLEATAGERIF